ncbi:Uncharacterised protein [uncultured archaeon]|nr:Uncharacterised protein [uncultured archaeon]
MKLKNAAIILGIIALLALAAVLLLPEAAPAPAPVLNGTAAMQELGRAGDYGYATFSYNGTGQVELLALTEQPKSRIIVLKQDYLNTERYSYFMDALSQLGSEGFAISESDSIGTPQNSIIVIPSGAMPADVLRRMDSLSASNRIIYIGRTDLLFSQNLVQSDWLANVSNSSRSRLIIVEKTLDEFYSEKNYSIFDSIRRNSWAAANDTVFNYSGDGVKTVFITLNGSEWVRMLPLADSPRLAEQPARITGNESVFPWQKAQLTVQMNYSNGTAAYSLEKDGAVVQGDTLTRVRGQEAFFLTLELPAPGDYLLRVSDNSGTIGAKRLHVKDLNISLANAYGNAYEFNVTLDGEPLDSAPAIVGLNHSNNTMESDVKSGKLLVHANLRQGENVFVITLFGKQNFVPYANSQESLITFYATYLTPGIILVALALGIARMGKRPVYRIRVPESVSVKNPEVRLSSREVVSAMDDVEKTFGWERVPLYAKEIGLGLKRLTGGKEVTEGNIEAVMKKLEEKKLIKSHLGLYGLAGWGDEKKAAVKRMVRDKLVQNGVGFSELPYGFDCGEKRIVLDPSKASRESVAVFEDREEMRAYLSSLEDDKRAMLEIKLRNGTLRLATLEELDELL